nr:hypothetical protein [Burkholderiaceae bacterium]
MAAALLLANHASWGAIAFGQDWGTTARQQNSPSFHYVHSDQWRYERGYSAYDTLPGQDGERIKENTIDMQVRAVRRGWLPFFPQFNRSSITVARDAAASGALNEAETIQYVVNQLKKGELGFAVEDPDAPQSW